MKMRESGTIKIPFSMKESGIDAKKYIHAHELFTWNVAIVSSGKRPVANELLLERKQEGKKDKAG